MGIPQASPDIALRAGDQVLARAFPNTADLVRSQHSPLESHHDEGSLLINVGPHALDLSKPIAQKIDVVRTGISDQTGRDFVVRNI